MLNKSHNHKGSWNTRIGTIAIALTAILLPACANNEQAATPDAATPDIAAQQRENVTASEVTERTNALVGQFVTVRSEPIQKVDEHVFTVTGGEPFNQRIAVVNATGQPVVLPEPQDAQLQVTGTVAKFDVNAIRQNYGLNLGEPNLYRDYEGRPAIIAQSVALAPPPGEIGEDPKPYYNKVIAVPAEVSRIINPTAFVLEDDTLIGDDPLLVLVTQTVKRTAPISQGQKIVATGTLRSFVIADLERDYNLVFDSQLRTQLEKEFNKEPVLVVNGIYPSALPESAK